MADDEEKKVAEMYGAVLVNRFYLAMSPNITRIAFIERFDSGAVEPRVAVAMNTTDAIMLYRLLGDLISKLPVASKEIH